MMPTPFVTSKPVLLVGGGYVDASIFVHWSNTLAVIAADGGADTALSFGVMPEWTFGDGDSLSLDSIVRTSGKYSQISEQNSTDFAKCLNQIQAPWILGLGFIGERFDHALASLNTLSQTDQKVVLVGAADAVMMVRVPENTPTEFRMNIPKNTRVSICPLSAVCFEYSQGLQYPLDGLTLGFGGQLGTSNNTIDDQIFIQTKIHDQPSSFAVLVPKAYYTSLLSK